MEWLIVAVILFVAVMAFGKLGDAMNQRRGEMYERGRKKERERDQ